MNTVIGNLLITRAVVNKVPWSEIFPVKASGSKLFTIQEGIIDCSLSLTPQSGFGQAIVFHDVATTAVSNIPCG